MIKGFARHSAASKQKTWPKLIPNFFLYFIYTLYFSFWSVPKLIFPNLHNNKNCEISFILGQVYLHPIFCLTTRRPLIWAHAITSLWTHNWCFYSVTARSGQGSTPCIETYSCLSLWSKFIHSTRKIGGVEFRTSSPLAQFPLRGEFN